MRQTGCGRIHVVLKEGELGPDQLRLKLFSCSYFMKLRILTFGDVRLKTLRFNRRVNYCEIHCCDRNSFLTAHTKTSMTHYWEHWEAAAHFTNIFRTSLCDRNVKMVFSHKPKWRGRRRPRLNLPPSAPISCCLTVVKATGWKGVWCGETRPQICPRSPSRPIGCCPRRWHVTALSPAQPECHETPNLDRCVSPTRKWAAWKQNGGAVFDVNSEEESFYS